MIVEELKEFEVSRVLSGSINRISWNRKN